MDSRNIASVISLSIEGLEAVLSDLRLLVKRARIMGVRDLESPPSSQWTDQYPETMDGPIPRDQGRTPGVPGKGDHRESLRASVFS